MLDKKASFGGIREQDLTNRCLDGASRRRSMSTTLDSALAGVVIIDRRTHRIVDVNTYAAQTIGLPKDRIVGQICHRLVCSTQEGRCPIDLDQTVNRRECVLLKADGTQVPILKTVAVDGERPGCIVESFVDISPLKQAEREARESLSLLEATFESTENALLVVDFSGKIKHRNRQFQQMWSIPDAFLGDTDDQKTLAHVAGQVKDPQAFLAGVRKLYDHPEVEGFDVLELLDGRIIERYSKPQRLGDRIVGRVWSFRDITDRRLAERNQAELLRQVAAINEELTHFAYIVSHDLKAPLRGIKLIAEWLCEDYGDKLGADAKEQLDLLQSRVARMHNLIDGVLQYSRAGRIKEETVRVDLNELIPSVIDGITPPEHIHITIQPDLPAILCERTRIAQVFQNLIGNAVKFMDKPQGEVRIGCVEDGSFWRFSVSDNGPGIEEKHFDRIFRLFQTLAPRDEFESTGVGLALVKKVVEMYGGRIWVQSQVGEGSTFLFTFPRQDRATPRMSSQPPEELNGSFGPDHSCADGPIGGER